LWRGDFVRLIICALLSANVMMLSWSLYSGFFTALSMEDIRYISWPIVVMAGGVMLYGGGPLFRKAWWGLKAGVPGMEVLVCMGAASAFLYSLYNFWADSWHLYFDTASMLITLVLLGKFLEANAKARVREDLESFLDLQPNKVRVCSDAFPRGRFVSLEQLAVGDEFRVKADEMVPADGRVTSGRGLVDLSALTGESRPQSAGVGDLLTSGSLLIDGDVTLAAERVGDEALVGQMIAIIKSGLSQRTALESRTDRWLAWFVPVMVGLAVATVIGSSILGLLWEDAFVRGLTVLVVACPCALGIAIPLARIAGMSGAGRMGILVRDFEAFERTNQIDSVVMDKTGTLTHGRWSLEQITVFDQVQEHEILSIAAGLEVNAGHAVSRAVLAHATKMDIAPATVEDVRVVQSGVSGIYQGRRVALGSWDFVRQGDQLPPVAATAENSLSPVFLKMDGIVCAMLGFGDKVRAGAENLVATLSDKNYGLHLISGDDHTVSLSVGRQLGIEHVHGELLPMDKADYVGRLQAQGHRVVMVGDGINDAPALSKADLSVAVYRDASLARQAANVTLMRGDPAQLMDFWNLAKQVNGKVAQNLGCAWIYNLVGIPIAMSGWLNPLIAATTMLLSSLTVIGNTLLLIKQKRL
jgi:heavy metal translocating P-type ATPase